MQLKLTQVKRELIDLYNWEVLGLIWLYTWLVLEVQTMLSALSVCLSLSSPASPPAPPRDQFYS